MNQNIHQPNRTSTRASITVVHTGDFGSAFAEQLAGRISGVATVDAENGTHPAHWPDSEMLVLATSGDRDALVQMTDDAAFAWRRPWVHVQLETTAVRCGPAVIPGRTACHECYRRRRQQHSRGTDRPVVREVEGWGAHHLEIALGMSVHAIAELRSGLPPTAIGATVRTFDLVEGNTEQNPVVAVNRCTRCRAPRTDYDRVDLFRSINLPASTTTVSTVSKEASHGTL